MNCTRTTHPLKRRSTTYSRIRVTQNAFTYAHTFALLFSQHLVQFVMLYRIYKKFLSAREFTNVFHERHKKSREKHDNYAQNMTEILLIFHSYLFEEQSARVKTQDFEVSLHALQSAIIKKRGQNFCVIVCYKNARFGCGSSDKTLKKFLIMCRNISLISFY